MQNLLNILLDSGLEPLIDRLSSKSNFHNVSEICMLCNAFASTHGITISNILSHKVRAKRKIV